MPTPYLWYTCFLFSSVGYTYAYTIFIIHQFSLFLSRLHLCLHRIYDTPVFSFPQWVTPMPTPYLWYTCFLFSSVGYTYAYTVFMIHLFSLFLSRLHLCLHRIYDTPVFSFPQWVTPMPTPYLWYTCVLFSSVGYTYMYAYTIFMIHQFSLLHSGLHLCLHCFLSSIVGYTYAYTIFIIHLFSLILNRLHLCLHHIYDTPVFSFPQ